MITINYSKFTNTGASTTPNTISAGSLSVKWSTFTNPTTSSGTSSFNVDCSEFDTSVQNTTPITIGGSGNNGHLNSFYSGGTASAVSISSALTIHQSTFSSSNANTITGAGSITYSDLSFTSGSTIDTTTQVLSGTLQGSKNTSPSAGFLGEQSISTVAAGAPVNLSDSVAANITFISLTPGVWDVSGVITFLSDAITGTAFVASVSGTSATSGTIGDNRVDTPYPPTAANHMSLTIPPYRVVTNTTINYYLVGFASFSVGTVNTCGRISATRVG